MKQTVATTESMTMPNETITITFGDQAENHKGNQIIGVPAPSGFTAAEVKAAKNVFESYGFECELIYLNEALNKTKYDGKAEPAYLLIVRKGVHALLGGSGRTADDLLRELQGLQWDSKYLGYGIVKDKICRHNLCMSDVGQNADYASGRGTIVPFGQLPCLSHIRNSIPAFVGGKANALQAEGNRYYNPSKCYIGWHGDKERKIVVALRLGKEMTLHYHWYKGWAPIGKLITVTLNHGDVYIMSEKAVGQDWKHPSLLTLRHSAGPKNFTTDVLELQKKKSQQKLLEKEKSNEGEEAQPSTNKKLKVI